MLKLTEIPIAESSRKVYLNALANLDKWLRGRPVTDENLAAIYHICSTGGSRQAMLWASTTGFEEVQILGRSGMR